MKRYLLMLTAVLVASAMLSGPSAPSAFALGKGPAWAGTPRHDRDRDNWGRHKKRERERYRFDEHDRRALREYYKHHRHNRAFRERLREEDYARLREGYVLDRGLRRRCRPLPVVLVRELPPCPPGYRYFFLGGDVVMVDDGYRVRDFIHLDINIPL